MAEGGDSEGKVIKHPNSKGSEESSRLKPNKIDRNVIDSSIDQAVAKRKTLGAAFIEFLSLVPIWLWLIVAGILFGLAKTLEYLSTRFYAHMNVETILHPSDNTFAMLLTWNRLAHFLNGFYYGFMGLAALIVLIVIVHIIRKYFWKPKEQV